MNEFIKQTELINTDKLFNGKFYADAEDFARGIKSVSDISGLSGKITKTDFLAWSFLPFKKE